MYNYKTNNGTQFNYNPDLSGDVEIIDYIYNRISIPGDDILDFVAEFIRQEKIKQVENMTTLELLGDI